MPILLDGALSLQYSEEGEGEAVVLVHGSASSNRQWRTLTERLRPRHRVVAVNLHGYGATTPWPGPARMSLYAQARLVAMALRQTEGPVHVVGHSTGGSVALKAASLLGPKVASLTLLEPNPFYLLKDVPRASEAWLEIAELRDHVQCLGAIGDWHGAAERFADYWLGAGSWSAMADRKRESFAGAMPPVAHDFDAVMDELVPIERWAALPCPTMLVGDPHTQAPIREVSRLFASRCRDWRFESISGAGHMAPLTRPDLVDPLVEEFIASSIGDALRCTKFRAA